ncbi:hypothetical protein C8R46DRAFT_288368 [Mycena filopes]|nr:hypothetical protein C8R46DRAFT_288368 [Mycena filopes]
MADKPTKHPSRYPRLRRLWDALRRPFSRLNSHSVSPQPLQPAVASASPPAAAIPLTDTAKPLAPLPPTDPSGGGTATQSVKVKDIEIDDVGLGLDPTPLLPAVTVSSPPTTPLPAVAHISQALSSADVIALPAAESSGDGAIRASDPGTESMNVKEVVLDGFGLALDVVEKLAGFGETIPFVSPVANVLSQLVKGYKEVKAVDEQRDALLARIMDIAQNLCSTIQVLKEKNHLDLIGRLKGDIEQYTRLLGEASRSVVEYNGLSAPLRAVAGTQFGTKFTDIQEKLASFGDRFRMNRLVDIAIQQGSFKQKVDKVHDIVLGKKLEQWLQSPPDMLQKQYEMQKLRQDGTGLWFLDGHMFAVWQDNPGVLWIEGDSGTGKSVLSSSVVNKLNDEQTQLRALGPLPAVAFFYFDINHKSGNMVDMALRRIILQLSAHSPNSYSTLEKRFDQSNGQITPNFLDLQLILEELLQELGHTYLILDALDECEELELPQLLHLIFTLRTKSQRTLHLLITSQRRTRFTDEFADLSHIFLEPELIGHDIKAFISHEVHHNYGLQIWKSRADEIIERVAHRSSGMFRLAACLLLELSHCTHQTELDDTLGNLPADLFGVYDRFFERIRPKDRVYAVGVLRWLLFSTKRLLLTEHAEAISFNISSTTGEFTFNPTLSPGYSQAILRWLEGLVSFHQKPEYDWILLAHASVQDYLLSPHFTERFNFNLSAGHSHSFIGRGCVAYLSHTLGHKPYHQYSLMRYAPRNWGYHVSHAIDRASLLSPVMRLLKDRSPQYIALDQLQLDFQIMGGTTTPIALCAKIDYSEGVSHLLHHGVDANQRDAMGNSLLDIAVKNESAQLVRILLDNRADPNAKHSKALTLAAATGHMETVQLLLNHGAEVNPALARETPMQAAASNGHTRIVQLLLTHGAELSPANARRTSLNAAASNGHTKTVQLLLAHGAEVLEQYLREHGGRRWNNLPVCRRFHIIYCDSV